MAYKCEECGCSCKRCTSSDHYIQLHVEIENLKQQLLERENHIVTMETNFLNEANKFPSGELVAVREELLTWQDKYRRLYEAHRRVQRVNQGLEDKLLKLVDTCETDKNTLTKDVATLSHKLAEANYAIKKLTEDNKRYKNDVSLAIQFLQCKQSNFVAHKFDTLSPEVQSQVSNYMTVKRKPEERKLVPDIKSIKVPIPTFPPTAMVYSVPKSPEAEKKMEQNSENPPVDIVSAAIMAKVLEERQRERALAKHCDTCTCAKNLKIIYDSTHHSIGTQTGDYKDLSCLRCNDVLQVSQGGMKIVRGNEKLQTVVPIYPLENMDSNQIPQLPSNIVKVQPNNFLVEEDLKSSSAHSSVTNLNSQTSSPKANLMNPNNHVISSGITNQDNAVKKVSSKMSLVTPISTSEDSTVSEKHVSEVNVDRSSAKNNSTEMPKGLKCNSNQVQSGTKNILLDNAQSNIAPILYTRAHKRSEDTVLTHENSHSISRLSADDKSNSKSTNQNQQQVSDWLQNNEVGSSESERLICKNELELDRARYAEMEMNVKRFLFGENKFESTPEVENETDRDNGKSSSDNPATNRRSLETNI